MFMRPRESSRPATLGLLLGLVCVAGGGTVAAGCKSENTKLTVTAIEPARGDAEGGTYVHIRGTRFTADGPRDAKVYFGGRAGTVHRFASDTDLIVAAPGGKPNEVVDVLVIFEPGGQLKIPSGFRYYEHNPAGPSVDDLIIKPGNAAPRK
jgi:IPT/TIG domain